VVNGDFDYSGTIDGTDYFLIDSVYLTQSGTLNTPAGASLMAAREAQFGSEYVRGPDRRGRPGAVALVVAWQWRRRVSSRGGGGAGRTAQRIAVRNAVPATMPDRRSPVANKSFVFLLRSRDV